MPTKIKAVSNEEGKGSHKIGAFSQKGSPPAGAAIGVVHKDFGPKGKSAKVVTGPHKLRHDPSLMKGSKKAKRA